MSALKHATSFLMQETVHPPASEITLMSQCLPTAFSSPSLPSHLYVVTKNDNDPDASIISVQTLSLIHLCQARSVMLTA